MIRPLRQARRHVGQRGHTRLRHNRRKRRRRGREWRRRSRRRHGIGRRSGSGRGRRCRLRAPDVAIGGGVVAEEALFLALADAGFKGDGVGVGEGGPGGWEVVPLVDEGLEVCGFGDLISFVVTGTECT